MKKIVILLILTSYISINAQSYPVTIYFEDGSIKKGESGNFQVGIKKINFKENNTDKIEKIEIKKLKKLEYDSDNIQNALAYEKFDLISGYRKNGEPIISKDIWLLKIYSGKISVYTKDIYYPGFRNMISGATFTPTEIHSFFFKYENEAPAFIFVNMTDPIVGKKKWIGKFIDYYFKDICPQIVTDYNEDKIKLYKSPMPLIDYYEKNCSSN